MRARRKLHCRLLAASVMWLLSMGTSVAQQMTSSDDLPTFVVPPRQPTEVSIATYLIGLSRVSEPSAAFTTFDTEMYIDVSWQDTRLTFSSDTGAARVFQEEEAAEKLSEIWSPDPEIQNEVEQRVTESIELRIFPDGTVEYEERFSAVIHAEFDLARFPFDKQVLELEFQSFTWDQKESVFLPDDERTGFDPAFKTPEWIVTDTTSRVGVRTEIRDDRDFSTFIFQIHAERQAGHYVLRFLLPLLFVMALTWSAFWMPPGQRSRVGFIALLTVVASHTAISGTLPRLNYPTFADIVLLVCYLYATALIVVSLKIQRLEDSEEDGMEERARKFDTWTRWCLPVAAILALGTAVIILWN